MILIKIFHLVYHNINHILCITHMDTNTHHNAVIKEPKVHFNLTSALKPRLVPQLGNQTYYSIQSK